MNALCRLVILLATFAVTASHATVNIEAFPPAAAGIDRYVLQLPARVDESHFKVELMVGKMVTVDKRNSYFFGGKIEEEAIPGWGFTYYKVSKLGPMAGTLMATDPGAPTVARFVTLGGAPSLIPYNSRLPIVVYVPEGVEVRYRLWRAGPEVRPMEKG